LSLTRPTTSATTLILAGFLVWPWLCLSAALSCLGVAPRGADAPAHGVVRPGGGPADWQRGLISFSLLCQIDEDLDDGDGDRDRDLPAGPPELLRPDPCPWTVTDLRPVPAPDLPHPALIVATHRFRC
jgi:hypothetical protein